MRGLNGAAQAYDRLLDGCSILAAILLGLIAAGVAFDVVLRNFGVVTLVWVTEVSEYALLAVTFLAAPWVLRQSAHVTVEIAVEAMSPAARRLASRAANAIGVAVCLVILYYGLAATIELYERDQRLFKTLIVKEWWLFAFVPFSMVLMAIEFALRLMERAAARGAGPAERRQSGL